MKLSLFFLVFIFVLTENLSAQECGPSCPVCSGTADGSLLAPMSFIIQSMSIPRGEDESGVFNLRYGILPRLDVGVGYGVDSEKYIWNARFQVINEKEKLPGIILGTGSVRTGKSDQSVYLHVTKSWEFSEMFALRMTAGIAGLVPEYDMIYGLGGLNISIADKFNPFVSYDGINFHEGLAFIPLDWLTISTMLVESRDFALAVGFKYSIPLKASLPVR